MVPLVYRRVREKFPHLEPLLRPLAHRQQLLAIHGTRQLLNLIQAFQEAGIRVLPLKGPVLSYQLWQDVGLRAFVDLDLLVHPSDLRRSWTVLEHLGYTLTDPPLQGLPAHLQTRILRRTHHSVWRSPDPTQLPVELHWHPVDPRWPVRLSSDMLLSRSQRLRLLGREIETLHPADLLIYLALHGTKHQWNRLLWLCDFFQAWHRWRHWINPEELRMYARETRTLKPLLLGFALIDRMASQPLPKGIRQDLQQFPELRWFAREHLESLLQGTRGPSGTLRRIVYEARMMGAGTHGFLVHALRLLVQRFFVPTLADFYALSLPSRWTVLYYPFRPFRWLTQRFLARLSQ